jgi:hypothetical protein
MEKTRNILLNKKKPTQIKMAAHDDGTGYNRLTVKEQLHIKEINRIESEIARSFRKMNRVESFVSSWNSEAVDDVASKLRMQGFVVILGKTQITVPEPVNKNLYTIRVYFRAKTLLND